jgi:hypothetical protein
MVHAAACVGGEAMNTSDISEAAKAVVRRNTDYQAVAPPSTG